jgi:hypothetical protein
MQTSLGRALEVLEECFVLRTDLWAIVARYLQSILWFGPGDVDIASASETEDPGQDPARV